MSPDKTDGRWLGRLMHLARVAQTWSKDPDERVGCAIASPDFREHAFGYNGLVPGSDDRTLVGMEKPMKDLLVRHAERNLLDHVVYNVGGWSLAVTKPPCYECAELILDRRIARVVVGSRPRVESRWYKAQTAAIDLLQEHGVQVWLDGLGSLDRRIAQPYGSEAERRHGSPA